MSTVNPKPARGKPGNRGPIYDVDGQRCRHSIDTPLALIGAAHLAISAGMKRARNSGLRRSGPTTETPRLSRRSRTKGASSDSLVAAARGRTTAGGVPLGNTKAIQALQSSPGTPCSSAVVRLFNTAGRVDPSV